LVKVTVRLALQRGATPTRVLVNDGMTWPWRADGGRFLSLSWVLAEEHVMVPLAMPTQMLGAAVSLWLPGGVLAKVDAGGSGVGYSGVVDWKMGWVRDEWAAGR
jgi:hypothetical protein